MYPLVIILGVSLLRREEKLMPFYVVPIAVLGVATALFHWLLQMGIIPEAAGPCQAGISCTTRYIEWFGFVTIPFLSLVAFATISTLMLMVHKTQRGVTA